MHDITSITYYTALHYSVLYIPAPLFSTLQCTEHFPGPAASAEELCVSGIGLHHRYTDALHSTGD